MLAAVLESMSMNEGYNIGAATQHWRFEALVLG
jgi:hypothetical protein